MSVTSAGPPPRKDRIVRAPLGLAGAVLAVLFYWASLTPSLLPRAWYLQGFVGGLTAAIGYGAGATTGALVRRVRRRRYPRATRIAWWALLAVAVLGGLTMPRTTSSGSSASACSPSWSCC